MTIRETFAEAGLDYDECRAWANPRYEEQRTPRMWDRPDGLRCVTDGAFFIEGSPGLLRGLSRVAAPSDWQACEAAARPLIDAPRLPAAWEPDTIRIIATDMWVRVVQVTVGGRQVPCAFLAEMCRLLRPETPVEAVATPIDSRSYVRDHYPIMGGSDALRWLLMPIRLQGPYRDALMEPDREVARDAR